MILDESHLLNETEKEAYIVLLSTYGFEMKDFQIKVTEDQEQMDMNDLNYVPVVKVRATHLKSHVTKVYENSLGAGIWLAEFEDDLAAGVFTKNS